MNFGTLKTPLAKTKLITLVILGTLEPHLLPIKDVECYVLRSNDQINQYGLPADEDKTLWHA